MVWTRCQMNHRLRASTVKKSPIPVLWSVFLSPVFIATLAPKNLKSLIPFFIFIQLNNTLRANDRRPISLHHSAEKGKHYITHNWKYLSRTLQVQSYSFDISKFTNNGPLLMAPQPPIHHILFILSSFALDCKPVNNESQSERQRWSVSLEPGGDVESSFSSLLTGTSQTLFRLNNGFGIIISNDVVRR